MEIVTVSLIVLVAGLHLLFMVMEIFMWETEIGLKAFGLTPEAAKHSVILAKNQGLYNGFLAAGLLWSFFIPDLEFQASLRILFLSFIVIAGIFGAVTAKFSIIYVQALPALLALIAVWYSKG